MLHALTWFSSAAAFCEALNPKPRTLNPNFRLVSTLNPAPRAGKERVQHHRRGWLGRWRGLDRGRALRDAHHLATFEQHGLCPRRWGCSEVGKDEPRQGGGFCRELGGDAAATGRCEADLPLLCCCCRRLGRWEGGSLGELVSRRCPAREGAEPRVCVAPHMQHWCLCSSPDRRHRGGMGHAHSRGGRSRRWPHAHRSEGCGRLRWGLCCPAARWRGGGVGGAGTCGREAAPSAT